MLISISLLLSAAAPQALGGQWDPQFARINNDIREGPLVVLEDMTGDGVPEIAVGGTGRAHAGNVGAVEIVNGQDGSLVRAIISPTSAQDFGAELAPISDVDGDGWTDLVVGMRLSQRVEIHTSSGTYIGAISDPAATHDTFGESVSSIADVDGDGWDDIVVGAPSAQVASGAKLGGAVELYSGASLTLIRRWEGTGNFGNAVTSCSDLDGDGLREVVASSPLSDARHGLVEILSSGTGATLQRIRGSVLLGPEAHDSEFGGRMCALDDLDGDGVEELLVAAIHYDIPLPEGGGAFVIASSTGQILHEVLGTTEKQLLGAAVAPAGDFDGDGFADFLLTDVQRVTLERSIHVHSGRTGERLVECREADLPYSISSSRVAVMGELGDEHHALVATGAAVQRIDFEPYLLASSSSYSLSAATPVEYRIDFADAMAGAHYQLLASASGLGPTTYGVDIPLTYDAVFDWTWRSPNPVLDREGWRGILDAQGDAVATLGPAFGFGPSVIGSYHLAAVTAPGPGSLAESSSFAVPLEIMP